jgi:5-formyltetrahydrofolate cyclo-ligase
MEGTLDKSAFRETFLGIRESMTEAMVAEGSAAVCRRLARMTLVREAETALAYVAFRNELDVSLLFDLLPDVDWVLPRVEGEKLVLHAYEPKGLIRHRYGMLEPPADSPSVGPEEVDLVLVPGVSFDRGGGRLGFGGGFYDRLLVRTPAVRVGICHDSCLAGDLPCSEHDQLMDWVVTPTVAIHCGPQWRRIGG